MDLSKAFLISQLFALASSASLRGARSNRELNNRIIGFTEAREGRYSYAVSLQDGVGHFCGGSLIAPDVILSAAHCMQNKAYQAVIGRHSLASTTGGDVVNVKSQIPHPNYNSTNTDNDYMILILDRDTTEDVDLVQLSPENITVGSAVTIMGWGDTDPTSTQTPAQELMETELFVISNDDCEQSSGSVGGIDVFGLVIGGYETSYSGRITDNMVCAKDNGEDSCQGDSGGPLVVHQDSGDDIQVGVVSWGVGCADSSFPGVYARISSQFDWIREQVCNGSSGPPTYFECDKSAPGAFETQSLVADGGTQTEGWTTLTEEDFSTGLGLFDQSTNNANHYNNAMSREGVVAITGGKGGHSVLQSNQISLANSPFTEFKITFAFYAIQMEHSDNLCLDYEIDDGAITGEKCWSSLHAFLNSRWYDDTSLQFSAPDNAQNLRIRFRLMGDDSDDNVLIDSVTIQGRADGQKSYSDISW